jgi:hypothetical protein
MFLNDKIFLIFKLCNLIIAKIFYKIDDSLITIQHPLKNDQIKTFGDEALKYYGEKERYF